MDSGAGGQAGMEAQKVRVVIAEDSVLLREGLTRLRADKGYDVVAEGVSEPGATGDTEVARWAEAGATFWVESDWSMGDDAVERHRRRIEAGPPTVA